MPCLACGRIPSDAAHIKSRGAGGGDEEWNIVPLCRRDHQLQHHIGWIAFFGKYPGVLFALQLMGWQVESGKLTRG